MSGQAGGRGYLLQSLICVLDILSDDQNWVTVSIEPDVGLDKVDILRVRPLNTAPPARRRSPSP